MKSPLLVFQSRESGFLGYRVPTNDVLDDAGTVATEALSAPLLMSLSYVPPEFAGYEPSFAIVDFTTVEGATEYRIERRAAGSDWALIYTVADVEGAMEISAQVSTNPPFPNPPAPHGSQFYRVIATDGVRTSVPSNVLLLGDYEPDESSVPVRDICSLGIESSAYDVVYRLTNYLTGTVQNLDATPDLVAPEWDGTLGYTFYNEFSGVPKHWVSGEPNQWSMNGGQFCRAQCYYQCDFYGTPTWSLQLLDNNTGGLIWSGQKIGGDSPAGVYSRLGGTESSPPAPDWFKVEATEGTTGVAVSDDCSPVVVGPEEESHTSDPAPL